MASEDEIRAAEARLGLRLPPSYRTHLLSSGGLPGSHGLTLLPPGDIDRFARRDPDWVAAWLEGDAIGAETYGPYDPAFDDPSDPATAHADQLADTIAVSETVDDRVVLLNPAIVDEAGEWEAWDFASWYPGAYRYPSFGRLVDVLAGERDE